MNWQRCLLIMAIVALAGCANLPKPEETLQQSNAAILQQAHQQNIATITQFTIKGRIGVQAEGKGFSGGLIWQHDSAHNNIVLFSPLGGQIASIQSTPNLVTLEDAKGNSITATDAESLTQSTLGWRLPLGGLADWSVGRPIDSEVQAHSWDALGHLSMLKQNGWSIEYQQYIEQNGYFLPSKIVLRNDKVYLKLLIESWITNNLKER